jgi:serine/threonine protein kinase
LCDFSFACHDESSSKQSFIYGTDEFMSPEVALALDFSFPADIFSFGIVLCELITNKEPSSTFLHRRPQDSFALDESELRFFLAVQTHWKLWLCCAVTLILRTDLLPALVWRNWR